MNKGKCRKGTYTTNEIIFHGPIVCWGFGGEPPCEYIKECLEDYKGCIPKRKFNNLIKKINPPKKI